MVSWIYMVISIFPARVQAGQLYVRHFQGLEVWRGPTRSRVLRSPWHADWRQITLLTSADRWLHSTWSRLRFPCWELLRPVSVQCCDKRMKSSVFRSYCMQRLQHLSNLYLWNPQGSSIKVARFFPQLRSTPHVPPEPWPRQELHGPNHTLTQRSRSNLERFQREHGPVGWRRPGKSWTPEGGFGLGQELWVCRELVRIHSAVCFRFHGTDCMLLSIREGPMAAIYYEWRVGKFGWLLPS